MKKYVEVKTDEIIPYVNNAKIHTEEQVLQIVSSIKEFGFVSPIIIDEDNNLLAGHGRLLAAKKMKLEKVPCIVVSDLTQAQRKAYILADNKIGENAQWNEELLKIELEGLEELDFDISLTGFDLEMLGFDDIELDISKEQKDESEKLSQQRYVKWGNQEVPITDEEEKLLNDKLNAYLGIYGTSYGFIREVLSDEI